MSRYAIGMFSLFFSIIAPAAGQEPQGVRLPVTADAGFSSVREMTRYSNGTGPATPIMQNQNWSGFENKNLLMAFDTGAVRGWTVEKAILHLYLPKGDLWGVGLCTVLSPWREGRALNGVEAEGAPCWDFRSTPAEGAKPTAENEWSWPGSKIYSVCWAHPAALYSHAGPGQIQREKTKDGRFLHLMVPVEPKVVEALAAGVAYGLALTDDKGQVRESYSLIGPAYPYLYNASEEPWVFTRDIHAPEYRPVLEVFGSASDKIPPAAPTDCKVAEVSASEGTVVLEFLAPGDDGEKGQILAYDVVQADRPVTAADWSLCKPLPRWSLPKPVQAGKTQRLPIFTLPPGRYHVGIRAVDEAGNHGPAVSIAVTIPQPPEAELAEARESFPQAGGAAVGSDEKLGVFVLPEMVKLDPVSGAILADGESYQLRPELLRKNPVWDAARGMIHLPAAANEVVAFQVVLNAKADKLSNARVSLSDLTAPGGKKIAAGNAECYRLWYVQAGGRPRRAVGPGDMDETEARPSNWQAEVCLPLKEPFEAGFDLPAADNKVPGQKFQSVWVDLYVPRGTAAGDYAGKVTVSADGVEKPVELSLSVKVLPLVLPDKFTWQVELNRYHGVVGWAGVDGQKDPDQADRTTWDYHALAHKHRCVLIVLPYSHSGRVDADYIPEMEGTGTEVRVKDWTAWDKRFAPLLDGSAFSVERGYVGPGAGVPVDHMYMAFHEAWPIWLDATTYKDWKDCTTRIDFAEYAKNARRPDVAFTDAYKQGFVRVAKQFFEHWQQKGYTRTDMQFYHNNKYYWKVAYFGGMGRGGVCFWLMDEPTDFDDYDANAFVLRLERQGQQAANAPDVRASYRTDVSQPEMTRGLWDGVSDVWCVGGWQRFAPTAGARQRWLTDERHWCYGGGVSPSDSPIGMTQAAVQRWAMGFTGWMPWWNCFGGTGGAWRKGDPLAVYYSGQNYAGSGKNYPGAIGSVRLKFLRRAQQDVEYLQLLAGTKGWDHGRVRKALEGYCDDPGQPVWSFGKLSADKADELRRRVIATILAEAR